MEVTFPAYDKDGQETVLLIKDFSLKLSDGEKEILIETLFDTQRAHAIADYLAKDASVKSVFSPAFLIDECNWPSEYNTCGGLVHYKSLHVENKEYVIPLVIIKKSKYGPYDENETFAHEVLGHLMFDQQLEEPFLFHPLSEAFARTIGLFLSSYRKEIMEDALSYGARTHDLVKMALTLYQKIGKRAIISLFYATKPEENPSLIERVCKEKEVVHSLAMLATEYGNDTLQKIVTHPFEDIVKKGKQVYRDSPRYDLMLAHLQEFSLGERFARFYLRDMKPSSLEELIEDKNVNLLDTASALKWQYAHAATPIPSYERGMRLFDHMVSTLNHITELEGKYPPSCYVPKNFERYVHYFGRGDALVNNFITLGLSYTDSCVLTEYNLSFVVAKRKIISFLQSPLRAAKGFL